MKISLLDGRHSKCSLAPVVGAYCPGQERWATSHYHGRTSPDSASEEGDLAALSSGPSLWFSLLWLAQLTLGARLTQHVVQRIELWSLRCLSRCFRLLSYVTSPFLIFFRYSTGHCVKTFYRAVGSWSWGDRVDSVNTDPSSDGALTLASVAHSSPCCSSFWLWDTWQQGWPKDDHQAQACREVTGLTSLEA